MNSTVRPLIVLALLISFASSALAGGTADYGVLRAAPASSTGQTSGQ